MTRTDMTAWAMPLLNSLFAVPFSQPSAPHNGCRGRSSAQPGERPGALPARPPRAQPVLPLRVWQPPPLPPRSELAWQPRLRAVAGPLRAAPRARPAPPRWLRAVAVSGFWTDHQEYATPSTFRLFAPVAACAVLSVAKVQMARRRSSRQGTSHEADRPFGRCNASIDQPQRSCHEACVVGGEERVDIGDFLDRAAASERSGSNKSLLNVLVDCSSLLVGPRGVDRPRAHAIGADAVLSLLNGNALHEGMQESLRSAISGVPRLPIDPAFRTSADDGPAGLPEMRKCEFGHQERGSDVAADVLIEFVDRHIVGFGIGDQHARIVDENVQLSEIPDGYVDAFPCSLLLRDIARKRHGLAAVGNDVTDDILDGIAGQSVDDDSRAFARQLAADCFANACTTTGDDGDLSLQRSVHGLIRRS